MARFSPLGFFFLLYFLNVRAFVVVAHSQVKRRVREMERVTLSNAVLRRVVYVIAIAILI